MLSGQYRSFGETAKKGLAIAEKDIASQQGRPLELIIYDHQFDKAVCNEKLEALRAKGVRYIADIMGSGLCLNAAPRFNSQKTIVLSAVNTAPSLTKEGGRYFFRVIPSDGVAARQIVEWVVSLNKMTAFVVYGKTDWGEQLHSVFDEAFVERGGKVLVEEAVSDDQILFGPLAQRMSEYPDAALFLAVAPNQAGLIVKEARKLGLRNLIFGTDNFTGQEIVTTGSVALDGVRYVAPGGASDGTNARRARFDELYRAAYGTEVPQIFSVAMFDAVHILYQVAQKAGEDTEKAISLLEPLQYDGASGKISFDSNHDLSVSAYKRYVFSRSGETVRRVETR